MKKQFQILTGFSFLWTFFSFTILQAQTIEQLTLDSCYVFGKRNYPLIKQYELIEKSLSYNLSNANKAYLPQLSITGIGGYVFGGLPSFAAPGTETEESNVHFIGIGQLNQTLWDGGATKTQKEITKAASQVEKANIDISVYSLHERVNQVYFGILLINEQLSQLSIQQDLLQKNVSKAAAFKENGLAYKTDVDEVEAEFLKTEQKRIEFNHARSGYVKMLSYLINKPLNDSVKLETPVEKVTGSGGISRPELLLFASQKQLATEQSYINRVSTMPKFGLLGAGMVISPGINLGPKEFSSLAIGGLSLSWNISGLYKISNNAQIQKLNVEKIGNQEEQFLFSTHLQLTQIKSEVDKKNAILIKDEEIVQLRSNIRQAYQLKYESGMCTMNDLLVATDKEGEAKANKALHKLDWLLSVYQYRTTNGN